MTIHDMQVKAEEARVRAVGLLDRAQSQAAAEGRPLTDSEKATIQAAMNDAKNLKQRYTNAQADQSFNGALQQLTTGMLASSSHGGRPGSIGRQIIDCEVGRWLLNTKGSARPARGPRREAN